MISDEELDREIAAAAKRAGVNISNGSGSDQPHDAEAPESAEIVRLARLPSLEYERQREAAAARLGVRVSALDDIVKVRHAESGQASGQGRAFEIPKPDPWPDVVDGAEL